MNERFNFQPNTCVKRKGKEGEKKENFLLKETQKRRGGERKRQREREIYIERNKESEAVVKLYLLSQYWISIYYTEAMSTSYWLTT